MSITGEPGGPPVKAGVPVTDLGAGLFALVGILAALEHRHRTGAGQQIDTSLVDAGVALSVWEATEYFSGIGVPTALGSAHRMNAPYQAIRCADGYITLGAANERLFRRLCEVLGHPEWSADAGLRRQREPGQASRGAGRADRSRSPRRSRARTGWRCSKRTTSRAGRSTTTRRCSRIRRCSRARWWSRRSTRRSDICRTLGSPIKMSATPPDVSRRAPQLGEHTDEVLTEAGLSDAEIAALRAAGAIG